MPWLNGLIGNHLGFYGDFFGSFFGHSKNEHPN